MAKKHGTKKATSAEFKKGQQYATDLLLDAIGATFPAIGANDVARLFGAKRTPASISQWKNGRGAPNRSAMEYFVKQLLSHPPKALLELEPILPFKRVGSSWRLAEADAERDRLRAIVGSKGGVYVFFDSAAQSTYVGQAKFKGKHDLFGEIEARLKQLYSGKTLFWVGNALRATKVKQGQIVRYLSVYEAVSPLHAHNLEALLLRTSMNHTGNARSGEFKFKG